MHRTGVVVVVFVVDRLYECIARFEFGVVVFVVVDVIVVMFFAVMRHVTLRHARVHVRCVVVRRFRVPTTCLVQWTRRSARGLVAEEIVGSLEIIVPI
jgi:hypothetical protein